ncbi:MAG: hypothetical protein LBJ00_18580 [Planctomycetaceae bacterium]|nr:hypothetical protein [Planctomycetaceae bacterium]
MVLITEAQQREAVVQGRSLSPYRLRYIYNPFCVNPKISASSACLQKPRSF